MEASRRAEIRLAALAPEFAEAESLGLEWLSNAERIRLDSMGSSVRRQQFVAGHWLLRSLAAEVLGGQPRQWLVEANKDGVPVLQSAQLSAGQGVHASLSHSGPWVAAAIAPFPVGLDIECPSKDRDLLGVAETAFSPSECAALRSLNKLEQAARFYLCWTLKEAVGKREGHGLRPETARRQQPIACDAGEADVVSWQFADCTLAIAGEAGMAIRSVGLPTDAQRGFWRIESLEP